MEENAKGVQTGAWGDQRVCRRVCGGVCGGCMNGCAEEFMEGFAEGCMEECHGCMMECSGMHRGCAEGCMEGCVEGQLPLATMDLEGNHNMPSKVRQKMEKFIFIYCQRCKKVSP